jgi:multidrug transporter EmrE-like cation transporter
MSLEPSRVITWPMLSLVLFSVGCSAIAQISLKYGMTQPAVQLAIAGSDAVRIGITVLLNPFVFSGLMLYGFSAVVWLFVLARLDLSIAYPFVSVGFVLTMSLGCLLFGEPFTLRKVLGTLVVMLGVYLVAAAR